MITEAGHEDPPGEWVSAFIRHLYPGPPDPQGDTVFRFTGSHAGHATDALPEVDHHGISFLSGYTLGPWCLETV